jgi:Fic family protein
MTDEFELKWSPITNITPEQSAALASDNLTGLAKAWRERREQLRKEGLLSEFETRLRREVAIETGLIERLYQWDRGVTETLVEQGITSALIPHDAGESPELVAAMIQDAEAAIESLFTIVSGKQPLTIHLINQLHAAVTNSQPTTKKLVKVGDREWFEDRPFIKGAFKQAENHVRLKDGRVHQYCPVLQTPTEMENLVRWHLEHEKAGLPPEVSSAWLHHRFTQIHPYEDGNGRVARLLASIILIKAEWFPLVMTNDRNEDYRAALLAADLGDLGPLVQVFSTSIEAGFLRALDIAPKTPAKQPVDQVIEALKRRLETRKTNMRAQWDRAKTMADTIAKRATNAFGELRNKLTPIDPSFRIRAMDDTVVRNERGADFAQRFNQFQVGQGAKRLGYFANVSLFHRWAILILDAPARSEILFSIHGVGREFTGQLVASMLFYRREEDEGASRVVELVPASRTHLLISYEDDEANLAKRFQQWFDDGVATAVGMWQTTL